MSPYSHIPPPPSKLDMDRCITFRKFLKFLTTFPFHVRVFACVVELVCLGLGCLTRRDLTSVWTKPDGKLLSTAMSVNATWSYYKHNKAQYINIMAKSTK